MDLEELQKEIDYLASWFGPGGESLVDLSIAYERTYLFNKLRDLIVEKTAENDDVAVEVLAWAWTKLAEV